MTTHQQLRLEYPCRLTSPLALCLASIPRALERYLAKRRRQVLQSCLTKKAG